jgi:hypothetical protein
MSLSRLCFVLRFYVCENFRCASSERVMEYYSSFAKEHGTEVGSFKSTNPGKPGYIITKLASRLAIKRPGLDSHRGQAIDRCRDTLRVI